MGGAVETLRALDAKFPGCLQASIEIPAREARYVPWPDWVPPELVERLRAHGVEQPWAHQVRAAEAARGGSHVLLATPTASGKSLATRLAALSEIVDAGPDAACALYVSPTKALAADQARSLAGWESLANLRVATYDGDTSTEDRRWARAHATFLLTNPDMLHLGLLGGHERWARLFRWLRYVIVDECHVYRGVFGSHMGNVLRRLLRVARRYGAEPRILLATATAGGDPRARIDFAESLVGEPVAVIDDDGSPHPGTLLGVWEPPMTGRGVRGGATNEAVALLSELVRSDVQTLAFVRSRAGAEWAAVRVREELEESSPALADRVAAYRGGYLPEERRALEHRLRAGSLVGLAATSALELGIDVAGMDAVITAGWPGSRASIWQQAGRAGRAQTSGLALFVARDDPLDQYLVQHPDELRPDGAGHSGAATQELRISEAFVCDPGNPHVLAGHLTCAAAEVPLTEDDLALFGPEAPAVVADLVERRELRRRPTGWFRTTGHGHREVSLRSAGSPFHLVENQTGRLLGTVDASSAFRDVHVGAVYLHQGQQYLVCELDADARVALLKATDLPYFTRSFGETHVRIDRELRASERGGVRWSFGDVVVTASVDGFRRIDAGTGRTLGEFGLDLPKGTLETRSVWWTAEDDLLASVADWPALEPDALGGAAHAGEHASIGLLPLLVNCDRSDVGGLSTPAHPDTGQCTVFVYDGTPGGAGYAEHAHATGARWLGATASVIRACPCEGGCPSCVQSPKCGSGNEPLEKGLGADLLDAVASALASG